MNVDYLYLDSSIEVRRTRKRCRRIASKRKGDNHTSITHGVVQP